MMNECRTCYSTCLCRPWMLILSCKANTQARLEHQSMILTSHPLKHTFQFVMDHGKPQSRIKTSIPLHSPDILFPTTKAHSLPSPQTPVTSRSQIDTDAFPSYDDLGMFQSRSVTLVLPWSPTLRRSSFFLLSPSASAYAGRWGAAQ